MTKFKLDIKKSILELFMIFLAISISFFIEEWRQDNQLKKRLIEDYNAISKDLDDDIKQLKEIISEHSSKNLVGHNLMDMLNNKIPFDYDRFLEKSKKIGTGNTFFGTTSAYDSITIQFGINC